MSQRAKRANPLMPESRLAAVQALLPMLPDLVAARAAAGEPIVVPDPGTEHGRRLYETLGVELEPPKDGAFREWLMERVVPDKHFGRWIERWKGMVADGWDLTVLIEEQGARKGQVIAFGFLLAGARPREPVDDELRLF